MIEFDKIEKVAEYKNGELNWLEGRDINEREAGEKRVIFFCFFMHKIYTKLYMHCLFFLWFELKA